MKKLVINKNDLKNNLEIAKKRAKGAIIYPVVKANAMGLGLVEYSKFLLENGIDTVCVATPDEAKELVENIDFGKVFLLSPCIDYEDLKYLVSKDVILTIGSLSELEQIKNVAKELNKDKVKAFVKVDTGFLRYGFLFNKTEDIAKVYEDSEVEVLGMFTHFSDAKNKEWTQKQFDRFIKASTKLMEKGIKPGIMHCSASTAFVKYPHMNLDAVRIGSFLQGRTVYKVDGLKKIGTFKSNITEIKVVPKGCFVSYSNTYKTRRDSKLAVVPVGYMDGLNRNRLTDDFSILNRIFLVAHDLKNLFKDNSMVVLIKGKRYKIRGRLGMYHAIVDITGSEDINVGDEVILNIPPVQTDDKIRREYI